MRKNTSTNRTRKWRKANKDKHNQYMREYRSKSRDDGIWRESDPRKRKALIRATPPWADREEILRIYEKCDQLNRRYPAMGFTVHHTIPISHPKVCGLHVPENLQVVSASLKMKLGRKFHLK